MASRWFSIFAALVAVLIVSENSAGAKLDENARLSLKRKAGWKGDTQQPRNVTGQRPKRYFGAKLSSPAELAARNYSRPVVSMKAEDIPESFDARDKWSYCPSIGTPRDQGQCESCWAVTSAATATDLTCIACKGQYSPSLSAEDLLNALQCTCDDGFWPDKALDYWVHKGLVTSACLPYDIQPNCKAQCQYSFPWTYQQDKHFGNMYNYINPSDNLDARVAAMQSAIMNYGPIIVSFHAYESFHHIDEHTGVYTCPTFGKYGGHAVKAIGWGVENDVPYWLVVNSWGTDWGSDGLFKIRRGFNDCNFETDVIWGQANSQACFVLQTTSETATTPTPRDTTPDIRTTPQALSTSPPVISTTLAVSTSSQSAVVTPVTKGTNPNVRIPVFSTFTVIAAWVIANFRL